MVRWVVGSILHGGARCSSVVRVFAHGAMGCLIDPSLSYFLFQPVLHDWCNIKALCRGNLLEK